ncbi:MAG TPA: hypothetical protein VLL25_11435 [Acidimicrobiales bacterium]|nr:hypothetical protein [Acidimicrobiales bacterium]
MTLVAFVSGRSPGLTTTVHALSLTWPRLRRAIVAELDPDGGCLAVRQELAAEPGLTTLAAAGRRGLAPDAVLGHCQQLRDGTVALLAPVGPERTASALAVLGTRLGVALDALTGVDVLADCGRIDSRSPALEFARSSRYVVLVVAPTLEGVAHSQGRLKSLGLAPGRVAVLTIGARPYRPEEVGAALDLPVLGSFANDRRGAEELAAGRLGRRSELLRSAAAVAERLAGHLTPVVPEAVRPAPPAGHAPPAVQAPPGPMWSPPEGNHAASAVNAHRDGPNLWP